MASVRWYNASAHYALYLAERLKKAGHAVCILGIPGSPLITRAGEAGIDVIESIDLSSGLSFISNIIKFRLLLNKKKFDIIHPHFSRDHTFAFFAAGSILPVIRTRSDSNPPGNNIINRLFYKYGARHYTVPANSLVEHLKSVGVKSGSISVIHQDIDYRNFSNYTPALDLKKILGISSGKTVVSFIGRLHKIKGVEYFLKSYSMLRNRDKIHYLISGEEIDISISSLKQLALENDIHNISIIGRDYDIKELLSITDIGVVPSLGSEAICRIALEMFSFGIPVVGTNINSIPEIISEYEGRIVKPASSGEIAAAIEEIASGGYYEMKKSILSKMRNNNPDRFVLEYLDLYSRYVN